MFMMLSIWQVSELLGRSWGEFADGIRPEHFVLEVDMESGVPRHGWQRTATGPSHGRQIEDRVRPRVSLSPQALFRSQGGPLSSVPFTCFPTSPLSRFDSSAPMLLLRRLPRIPAGVPSP